MPHSMPIPFHTVGPTFAYRELPSPLAAPARAQGVGVRGQCGHAQQEPQRQGAGPSVASRRPDSDGFSSTARSALAE